MHFKYIVCLHIIIFLCYIKFFAHSFVQVMVRMRKMCEEIAEGRYTIPEVGIDVDYSLVLFLTMCMEVCVCVCVCVCVVCMYMCVCEKERESIGSCYSSLPCFII